MKKFIYAIALMVSFGGYATEDIAKKNDILEFIRTTAVTEEVLNLFVPAAAQNLLETSGKDIKAEDLVFSAKKQISSDEFLERFVGPFDEIFSHDEIKTLIQYYKSEEMKKFNKNNGQLFSPIFSALPGVIQGILNDLPETEASAMKKLNDFVIPITKNNYQGEIQESEIPVVIDVYSTYCRPCKIVAPIFSELSSELMGKIKFAKLNVDEEFALAQELKIRAMPTFLFIKNGEIVDRHVGALDKEGLLSKIQKNLF